MNNVLDEQKALRPAYDEAAEIRANSGSLAFSGIAIVITLAIMAALIGMDSFSEKTELYMKGCAGICAILSIISATVFFYRVNLAYWEDRLRQ